LEDVLLNPTRTGLLDALKAMGADLEWTVIGNENGEPVGSIEAGYSELKAIEVEGLLVVRMIDEFPAFAVAAACAHGQTIVRNAEELRTKETDRISALVEELGKIGIDAGETPDGFVIRGGQPVRGGRVHPHGDHRLAMSLAVAGLIAENPVTVMDAQLIAESFPAFTDILAHLGADIVLG
jgi:3-phosphoshikimate 1-carboxyvinyltransferase